MSDLMYTPLENVFADTLAREGKSITAVISGKTFTAFFRRCDDGQSTEDRIMLYYEVDAPVNQGSLIQYGKKTYVLVNKETEENTCYYKSFAIACNGILNTNNRTVKNVPVYGYDLKNGLTSVNNTISIVNGNMEFVSEITDTVKVLAIDDTFNIYGRRNEATTEAEIQELTEEIDNLFLKVNPDQYMVRPQFTKGLKSTPKKKKKHFTDEKEKELYRRKQILLAQERKALEEKIYIPLECTMDKLATVIKEHLERAERTKMITFVDILNPIPKGTKADYNRIEAIKKIGLEWNNRLNQVYAKYASGDMTAEEMFEMKQNLIQNALNEIRYSDVNQTIERKITTWDIQKLIRDIFDIHPHRNKHGKIIKDEKGKIVLDDKRDKRLIGDKKKHCLGQTLLQWIYEIYPKEFLAAIKSNPGTVTYLEEITENESSKTSVKSLKDLNQLLTRDEIHELYGKKYQIKTKVVQ